MRFFMDLLRHHRKAILGFIIVVIGIPFIFFFGQPAWKSGNDEMEDPVVARVGGVPIYAAAFRNQLENALERGSQQGAPRKTIEDLSKDGTADQVFRQLVNSAFLTLAQDQKGFDFSTDLAIEQLKKEPAFQNEAGKFDPRAWNRWVKNAQIRNWDDVYADAKKDLARQMYIALETAAAGHVLDKEISDELEANTTKLKAKYAKIEPKLDVTDEQVAAYFEANKEKYRKPTTHTVEFARISLLPPLPEKATEAVKKAREGADFDQLVTEYGQADRSTPIDWTAENENEPSMRKPLFALKPGEISEPVITPRGVLIYRLDEERTNDQGKREVKARQIYINSPLAPEEKSAREAKAQEVLAKAQEKKDLKAAAQEAGLEVLQANAFNKESLTVENIPMMDSGRFRMAFDPKPSGEPVAEYQTVAGLENVYIAHALSSAPGELSTLDEVRDKVKTAVIADEKQKDGYKAQVKEYCDKFQALTGTLEERSKALPDLPITILETPQAFTKKDYFLQQVYVGTQELCEQFKDAQPGAIAGPVSSFMGETYFFELTEKTPPTEEEKKNWDTEAKDLRKRQMDMAKNQIISDFVVTLSKKMVMEGVSISEDSAVKSRVLGKDRPASTTGAEGEKTAEGEKAAEGQATAAK